MTTPGKKENFTRSQTGSASYESDTPPKNVVKKSSFARLKQAENLPKKRIKKTQFESSQEENPFSDVEQIESCSVKTEDFLSKLDNQVKPKKKKVEYSDNFNTQKSRKRYTKASQKGATAKKIN